MKRTKMTEDQAAAKVLAIARRVQAGHPDEESIGLLIAAAATLLLAGFTDPRDRHVVHAADRMRDRLTEASAGPPPSTATEPRRLNERQQAILDGVRPTFAAALERIRGAVPESTYRLWIEPLVVCGLADGKRLLVNAPEGIRAWCERRYSVLLVRALAEVDEAIDSVAFVGWVPSDAPTCNSQQDDGVPPSREQEDST
jgi:hypothetical protein